MDFETYRGISNATNISGGGQDNANLKGLDDSYKARFKRAGISLLVGSSKGEAGCLAGD